MPGSFFDTNVVLDLAFNDPAKAGRPANIIAAGGVISVQALDEIAHAARRKMRRSWEET